MKAGDSVLLQFDETTFAFVSNVQPNTRVKTRKKQFFSGSLLIGQPYGALFEQRVRVRPLLHLCVLSSAHVRRARSGAKTSACGRTT